MQNQNVYLHKLSPKELPVETIEALKEVPYYSKKISLIDDWVPMSSFVDSKLVFSQFKQFIDPNYQSTYTFLSGGTINSPKHIPYTIEDYTKSISSTTRALKITKQLSQNQRVCLLHPFAPWSIGGIFQEAIAKIGCKILVLGLGMNEQRIKKEVLSFNPDVFVGPASLIVKLLSDIDSQKKYESVINAGEVLYPFQRDFFKARKIKSFNIYGMSEFDTLGAECPHGSLHLLFDEFYFEMIRTGVPGNNGLIGELVITPINRQAYKVFRYLSGDQVEISKHEICPCGIKGTIINNVGRENAFFIDGVTISDIDLEHAVEKMKLPLLDYQIRIKTSQSGIIIIQFVFSALKKLYPIELSKIVHSLEHVNIDWEDLIQCKSIEIAPPIQKKKLLPNCSERGKPNRILWEN